MVVGVVFSAGAQAAPGDLDLTFSGDGKQTTGFGFGLSEAAATVRQPDGRIVAVGTDRGHGSSGNGSTDFALARYNPNGSLDTSFSGDGKQTTGFGSGGQGFAEATGVALQGDGKIVVVGHAGFSDFALARYNPNGALDTSFSGDGKQTTDFGGSDQANGVAIQADGKIVAVGRGGPGAALARYNPNGTLDTSFSGDGKKTTTILAPNAVALQGDGKIVAAGFASGTSNLDFALARFNPDGSLDTSFSGDGKQTTDFGSDDAATGVALQADGKIVAVGGGLDFSQDFALARYNPNGALDTSFSGDGKQTTDFGGCCDGATGVVLQGDGKIVAVGHAGAGDFALARYNANGSLDTSFSGDGKQTTNFGGGDDQANALALQGDGKIVAVGFTGGVATSSGDNDFALARYNPNGSLDTTFSGDGKQTTDFGGGAVGDEGATDVAIQTNGKIVAVGNNGNGDFALARYNPNGTLDTTFSGDGKLTTDFGLGELDQATGVAIQADGKIVVVGAGGFGAYFALARYNPNGSLDTSFSGDGKQTTSFSVGGFEGATGVALQGDAKIIAVGDDGGGDFALARYNPNGSLDTSFSGDGKQTTDFGLGADDLAKGVALQGDGKILAAGVASGGITGTDFALARYNTDGSLDMSFSGDGRRRTNFGDPDAATGVTVQGDGKIVAIGTAAGGPTGYDFALARYIGG